jgi:exonuclease III
MSFKLLMRSGSGDLQTEARGQVDTFNNSIVKLIIEEEESQIIGTCRDDMIRTNPPKSRKDTKTIINRRGRRMMEKGKGPDLETLKRSWTEKQYKKWVHKCFTRREYKRLSGNISAQKEPNCNEWKTVGRNQIKASSNLVIATWNVRTMRSPGANEQLTADLKKHKVLIAALQEVRWEDELRGQKHGDYKFWGGGAWRNKSKATQGGVGIAVHKSLWDAVDQCKLMSGRAMVMSFHGQLGKRLIVGSLWCPTEQDEVSEKESFWKDFRTVLKGPAANKKLNSRDMKLMCGDFNGELPTFNDEDLQSGLHYVVGRWGMGKPNKNGLRLHEEASLAKLISSSSLVRKSFKQRWTFQGKFNTTVATSRREYDHILLPFRQRASVINVRTVRSTLLDSDHCPVIAELKFRADLSIPKLPASITKKLRSKEVAQVVDMELSNRFAILEEGEDIDGDLTEIWHEFSETVTKTTEQYQDKQAVSKQKPWISDETLTLIRKRSKIKEEIFESDITPVEQVDKLKSIRKTIRKSAKQDKKRWLESIVEEAKKAGNVGDTRKIYRLVRLIAGKGFGGSSSLDGSDPDIWVNHFVKLLGEAKPPENTAPEIIKATKAWRTCKDKIDDLEEHAEEWKVNTNVPNREEVIKSLKNIKANKACAEIIPPEFFLNSDIACGILTACIIKVWNKETPPECWLKAALCLLYKNKGRKDDPNNFRGISLLSSAEKVLSVLILLRIKEPLEARILEGQSGFRSGKSCRDAAFILMRNIDEHLRTGEPIILDFVDFSKAFDSLDWDTMWKIMKYQGMPPKIIEMIKVLYTNSSVAVRLNAEGKSAPAFKQKVGIRQGCSLSPAIFILILDFAMRMFEHACKELKLTEHSIWSGYADDLVLKSLKEEEAQKVLHQLQGACAFVGLYVNVKKTECMAIGVKTTEVTLEATIKERVEVVWKKKSRRGWIVDWNARLMGPYDTRIFDADGPSHIIRYDDGDIIPIKLKKAGWLMNARGEKKRITKLGFVESVDESKNSIRCSKCLSVFKLEKGLKAHARVCRQQETLTTREMQVLRKSRLNAEKIKGLEQARVELIDIKAIEGKEIKPVHEFKYLGSLLTNTGKVAKEVTRRIASASAVFSSLSRIWESSVFNIDLKLSLFRSLVVTILLYNGECWDVKAKDEKRLEGFYFRCLRRLSKSKRRVKGKATDKASKMAVYQATKAPSCLNLLKEKRLRWIGHLLRTKDDDQARRCLMRQVGTGSGWWRLILQDLKSIGKTWKMAQKDARNKPKWRTLSWARVVFKRS